MPRQLAAFVYGCAFVIVVLGLIRDTKMLSKEVKEKETQYPSMFDNARGILYKQATEPVKIERKKLTLKGWNRGSGGLLDSDRLLIGELYFNATSVFEFGLGESTKIAAHVGVPRYSGVDSDALWVTKAREDASMDHFRFYFGDIGKTRNFGNPTNESLQKIHYNYQIAPLAAESKAFDFYLVDGRYRTACACASFLHAMSHGGDMSRVMVAVHDSDRDLYGLHIGKVAKVVEKSKLLSVYKLNKNVTEEDVFHVWETVVSLVQ